MYLLVIWKEAMKKWQENIDIDLFEPGGKYIRRCGLVETPCGYQKTEDRHGYSIFPASCAEAAYLLVGLVYEDDGLISYKNVADYEGIAEKIRLARIQAFMTRNGCELYQKLNCDLLQGTLTNLTLPSLKSWVEEQKVEFDFPYLSNDLEQQIQKIIDIMNGNNITMCASIGVETFVKQSIEKVMYTDIKNLKFVDGKCRKVRRSKDRKKGKANLCVHKNKVRSWANKWIEAYPNQKIATFYQAFLLEKFENDKAFSRKIYKIETVKRWLKDIPFNRLPGAISKSSL